jgi:predicted 3-demethylubiquinone-9 3-methyltransferase (glyoxalase superfamily)
MTHSVRTVLWFSSRGREAAEYYCSLIPNSHWESAFASDNGGPDGNMHFEVIDLALNGVPYQILEAGPMFPLSECVSIMVQTPDQAETDRLWEALTANGGEESQCGWLRDRFGLSWQIVPEGAMQLLSNRRAYDALMTMRKIDLAALEAAARADG